MKELEYGFGFQAESPLDPLTQKGFYPFPGEACVFKKCCKKYKKGKRCKKCPKQAS